MVPVEFLFNPLFWSDDLTWISSFGEVGLRELILFFTTFSSSPRKGFERLDSKSLFGERACEGGVRRVAGEPVRDSAAPDLGVVGLHRWSPIPPPPPSPNPPQSTSVSPTAQIEHRLRHPWPVITTLKKGAYLLKYGSRGKAKFCPFQLANVVSSR